MKLGVIGGGTVGTALARSYMEWCDVRVFDTVRERRTHSLAEALAGDVIMVCLPTPKCPDSMACDLSAVEGFFASQEGSDANFVLRSTVPVGTTRRLREQYSLANLTFSPEFLTARCSFTDAQMPARNIVGGSVCDGAAALMKLYRRRFPGVPTHLMTSDEAELVKLATNCFFSVKLSYWNEVRHLADKLNLDWDRVMRGILADGRIAHSHTSVPGPDGKFGFGPDNPNACLPKDLASLIHQMDALDLQPGVMRAAFERNELLDRPRAT